MLVVAWNLISKALAHITKQICSTMEEHSRPCKE
jgi:hypothetical protein